MFRYKIRLDTMTDVNKFVLLASRVTPETKITVSDNDGHAVNGKSLLGALYAMEFDEVYCESNVDVYSLFEDFIE